MKYYVFSILTLVVVYGYSQTPTTDASWSLHYDTDFNNDYSRWQTNWNNSYASGGSGWKMPYWTPNPATNETYYASHVFLTGNAAPLNLLMDYQGGEHRTGGLVTHVQVNTPEVFGFGYYEAEIKLPIGNGLWPAFWLYNEDVTNPTPLNSCVRAEEIDIMESLQKDGVDNEHFVGHNLHYPVDEVNCPGGHLNGWGSPQENEFFSWEWEPVTGYNKYAVEWSPEMLIWYFNGRPFRELYFHEGIPITDHTQIHLTFQFADTFETGSPLPVFPDTMQVNYVKVWELTAASNCDNSASHVDITNQSGLNNYSHLVRYSVKIWPDANITVQNNSHITFRASDHIEITRNFTVGIGESATFLVHGCPP